MNSKFYDIAICGGGVMGSSIAYNLSKILGRSSRIVVIERDPKYAKASGMLSVQKPTFYIDALTIYVGRRYSSTIFSP
jgi:glycine/D-amino acid oxidase-like deaminating enzyme